MKNNPSSTMNSNNRTFRRGKHHARAQTFRAGCGLAGLLAALALAFLTPRVARGALMLEVGTHSLIGDLTTPQTIVLSVNNTGSPIGVGALDFYIQLGSGAGTTPFISTVDLLNGTIFEFNNSGQSGDPDNGPQLQFHAVLRAGPVGSGPEIPTGMSQLATISFVTEGTASGSFSLLLSVPGVGDTDFLTDTASPTAVGLIIGNGTLELTPVPEPSTVVAAVFLLLLAGFHTLRQRQRRSHETHGDLKGATTASAILPT